MMMRFPSILIGLLLVTPALATFHKDVVSSRGRGSKSNSNSNKPSFHHKERDMQNSILSKAMPLADYQAKMGIEPTANANDRRLEDGDDDADQNLYSFSGYSIKYAKCQPVQYFSEDAVAAGMRSPMVTNDIVILRLCPQTSCSQSREYGCVYNYAEYALSMSDYLQIMMEYSQQKKEYTCDYCDACINEERRLEDGDNDEDGNDDADGNDQDNDADAEEDDDEEEGNDDGQAANYDYSQNNNCGDNWDTYCSDYAYMCQDEEDQDQQNGGYNGGYNEYDYDSYEDYMQCAKVNYNDYAYFMKPTCNAYTGVIEFGIYFDDYCSESATSKVSLNKLGLGLSDSIFEEFYSGQCIDCSESDVGPYYNSNSYMCNELHQSSAKCTSRLMNDLFDGAEDDDIECSFIESLRFGAYDETGQFMTSNVSGSSWSYEPTIGQKVMLGLSIALSVIFVIYSCYLHHAMTNLLIKSLSHRELLPPNRQRQRANSNPRRGRGMKKVVPDDATDWNGEAA